ncbi:serine/threonine-protein phosphatase 7 long form homolog [Arachis hypogaea]|uniref:serine/threonine-protein phosphatase 7 long form homolog n=1 Tax=Arachis hypogaea TaxID=3818 RepID=UPI003B21092F
MGLRKMQVAFVSVAELNGGCAIRNLLPRKLDSPDTFNEVAAATLALIGFQHVLRVGEMRGHSALLSALVECWRPETHTFHLPVREVTVTLEDVSYILGLPINGEAVAGRSDSSHQFLVGNCIACFGREPGPQDHFGGSQSGTPIQIVVSCITIQLQGDRWPTDTAFYLGVGAYAAPGTYTPRSARRCWWSHWRRHTRYIRQPTAHFRRGLNDMGVDDFIWRPYMGVEVPDFLAAQMVMYSTQSPLVSFECIEWHSTDRVRRQFGMQQLPPGPAFDLGRDHYKRLTGAHNHDWGEIYSQWVNRWKFDHYNALQLGEEIIDFHPLPMYYEWYTQQYGMYLRLSDRVAGEEVGVDEPQQQQEEPAGPQQQVPPHEQQF